MNKTRLIGLLAVCFMLCAMGCRSYGPASIIPDRFDYSASLAQSWKNQLVQNLVRIRYGGTPHFVEVSGILSQYSLNAQAMGGFIINSEGVRGLTQAPFSFSGSFTESPTITYTPLVGEDFTERLLTPIDPVTIIYIAQSGWPIDHILELCVDQINGIRNYDVFTPSGELTEDAKKSEYEFDRLVRIMKELQTQGLLDIRVEQAGRKVTLFLPQITYGKSQESLVKEMRSLLNLDPMAMEFTLVQSPIQRSPNEIAIQTRSVLTILIALSSAVQVPEIHKEKNFVYEESQMKMPQTTQEHLLEIGVNKKAQKDVYIQIRYRDHYYFVKDEDARSKRTLALITYLFNLQSRESGRMGPLITVPAAASP